MKKWLLMFVGLTVLTAVAAGQPPVWREDFAPDRVRDGKPELSDWELEGTKFRTPATRFYLRKDPERPDKYLLVVESPKGTGVFVKDMSGIVDLNKTPIVRWRWRALKLPKDADGRDSRRDDQAVAIYIGTGSLLNQKSVAYRWETKTPRDHEGTVRYSGVMQVHYICLRNDKDPLGEWVTEERNIRDDFRKAFGFVPAKFGLSVCGNGQYTGSDTLAEVDYIEFLPESAGEKKTAE